MSNLRKGQAEIALILGLLVIAAVVGIYSYSSLTPPSIEQVALTEEQKAVAVYVNDVLREAAIETVAELYSNGGYLDGSLRYMGYVDNGFGPVAYWQMCDNYAVPDISVHLSEGVKNYITENLPDTETITGRTAVFTKAGIVVSTKLYDNKVTVLATIPTVYEGSQIPQPYRIDISTSLGRIADFAENFAMMQADCRVLDYNLIKSLAGSAETSRPCWIPFGMGNARKDYTFTWTQLRDCMELHAKNSVATTKIGYWIPTNEDGQLVSLVGTGWDGTSLEFGFIPTVIDYSSVPEGSRACGENPPAGINGDAYNDLNIMFYFGDDDGLDKTEFSGPDRLEIRRSTGSVSQYLGGFTVAEYSQAYSVKYPVIVSVWDNDMGRSFNFATFVFMDNNQVGHGCQTSPALPPIQQGFASSYYDYNCGTMATKDANVYIKYKDDGSMVPGADVSFDGCSLGNTGSGQIVEGRVPATAIGALKVRVDDNEYTKSVPYSSLVDYTFYIPRSKTYDFHFFQVPITKDVATYTAGTPVLISSGAATVNLERTDVDVFDMSGVRDIISAESVKEVYRLPLYEYTAIGGLKNEGGVWLGAVTTTGFTPSLDYDDIYVYIPSMSGFDAGTDMDSIKHLYDNCATLALISNGPLSYTGDCSWSG